MRQLKAGGIGVRLQVSDGRHNKAWHTKRALEALFVDNALLHRMQASVSAGQALDGHNFPSTHCMREHRTRIEGNIVDQHGTSSAFSTIAPQLGTSET